MNKCKERQIRLAKEVHACFEADGTEKATLGDERLYRQTVCERCSSRSASGVCTEKDSYTVYLSIMRDETCPLGKWEKA
jgi:hypothetical protein